MTSLPTMQPAATLPLRLTPNPGESWLGYTRRLAAHNGVTWHDLMTPLFPAGSRRPTYPLTPVMSGVAATPATTHAFARYLGLLPTQVEDLHLTKFSGSALTFSAGDHELFDPLIESENQTARVLRRLGFVSPVREPRACPACVQEAPERDLLTWRLGWHVVCTEHRILITRLDRADERTFAVHDEHVDAQQQVLARLVPQPPNRAFFGDLTDITAHVLGNGFTATASTFLEPEQLAQRLPDLIQVLNDPGYPLAHGLVSDAKTPRLPLELMRAPRSRLHPPAAPSPDWFPRLLPTRLMRPALSDLCYPTTPRQARMTSALAAYMIAFECDLARAADELVPGRPLLPAGAARLMVRVESEGRMERFWDAATQAATQIMQDRIDYRARERAAAHPRAHGVASAAEPQARSRIIRTWLVDQWACAYTTTRSPRPSSRTGLIEEFDDRYGPAMTAALEHHVQAVA